MRELKCWGLALREKIPGYRKVGFIGRIDLRRKINFFGKSCSTRSWDSIESTSETSHQSVVDWDGGKSLCLDSLPYGMRDFPLSDGSP